MNSNSTGVPAPNTSPSRERKQEASTKNNASQSKNIPITNHIHRTESEIRLCEDEAQAEYRDSCMYNRLVSGISRQQEETPHGQGRSLDFLYESGECISNIMRTRHAQHPDECESLHSRHERAWKTIRGESTGAPPHRPKSANDADEHGHPVQHSSFNAPGSSFLSQTFLNDDEDQVFMMDP